jgi:hypothetical protein
MGQISLKHPYKKGKLDVSLHFEKSDEEDVPLQDYTPFHFDKFQRYFEQ